MQAAKRKRKSQKRLDAALRAAQAAKERDRLWKSEACGPWRPQAARGVRAFSIELDDALIFQGTLRPAPPRSAGATAPDGDFVQTVMRSDTLHVASMHA